MLAKRKLLFGLFLLGAGLIALVGLLTPQTASADAGPGGGADHGLRRSGFRHRRRGRRDRRAEAARARRQAPGAVRDPPAAGRRARPRALPGQQGAGGRHDPELGRIAGREAARGRTRAHARWRGSQQGSAGRGQAAAEQRCLT